MRRAATPTLWERVYRIVKKIPRGRVMTYGRVSELLGRRISPRYVGFALHVCPRDVPWHRVVNSKGGCSTDGLNPDEAGRQRARLEAEGVEFEPNGRIDLAVYMAGRRRPGGSRRTTR